MYGPDGEFTVGHALIPQVEGDIPVQFTAIYGDRQGDSNKWNRQIFKAISQYSNNIIGGDWNMVIHKVDTTSEHATQSKILKEILSTTHFEPTHQLGLPNQHTRIGGKQHKSSSRLDFFLISNSLTEKMDFEGFQTYASQDYPVGEHLLNAAIDHCPVGFSLSFQSTQQSKPVVPLNTRLWHKRHIECYQTVMTNWDFDVTQPPSHLATQCLVSQMKSAMKETNLRFFNSNLIKTHTHQPNTELTYLRQLGKRKNKKFFEMAKSPCLLPKPNPQIFPSAQDTCGFMETCPGSLPPHPHFLSSIGEPNANISFSIKEVKNALKVTKRKSGQDLPPFLFYVLPEKFLNYISNYLSFCFVEGVTPQWRRVSLWTIHKKGSRTAPTNFRPISIPHPIYRAYSKLLLPKLQSILEPALYKYQYGFRKNHSCTQLNILFRAHRKKFVQKHKNKIVVSIFVDIAKAFDSVNHKKLFDKLYDILPLNLARGIHHLYVDGTEGEPISNNPQHLTYTQQTGVRQGCPLSPL